jgi:hypothetical protein
MGQEIEKARRAYVAAIGTEDEAARRLDLARAVDSARTTQHGAKRTA